MMEGDSRWLPPALSIYGGVTVSWPNGVAKTQELNIWWFLALNIYVRSLSKGMAGASLLSQVQSGSPAPSAWLQSRTSFRQP